MAFSALLIRGREGDNASESFVKFCDVDKIVNHKWGLRAKPPAPEKFRLFFSNIAPFGGHV